MLRLEGVVLNVFQTPKGETKEGKSYGGEYRVQMQADTILSNGEKRIELVNMSTDKPDKFIENTGKTISVKVGAFARSSAIHYFLPSDFDIKVCGSVGKPFSEKSHVI